LAAPVVDGKLQGDGVGDPAHVGLDDQVGHRVARRGHHPDALQPGEPLGEGSSIRGRADIEARSYSDALQLCCQNAPIVDLEWHLEEKMAPEDLERILTESLK
jgi:hypothetical protein